MLSNGKTNVELSWDYYLGRKFTYTGFGYTEIQRQIDIYGNVIDNPINPKYLHYSQAEVVQSAKCNYLYPHSKLCVELRSHPDATICQGDSGGALFDERTKEIVGVVSIGGGHCSINFASTYTRVINFIGIIKAAMNNSHFANLNKWHCEITDLYKRELQNDYEKKYTRIDDDISSTVPSTVRPEIPYRQNPIPIYLPNFDPITSTIPKISPFGF